MTRPVVVQHSFGDPGSGGPIGVLARLQTSFLSEKYEFIELHQSGPIGGVSPRLISEWAARLRQLSPAMIHVRGLGNEGFHAAAAARAAGVKRILVSIHGTQRDLVNIAGVKARARRATVAQIAEPLTLAAATHVATVCEYAARRPFVARHSRKFVGVVPNGVPARLASAAERTQAREAMGIPQTAFSIAYVGRMSLDKGLLDLAQGLTGQLAGLGETHVLLAGDGPARAQVSRTFASVDGLVTHELGRVENVSPVLAAADAFILPSLHENLSNALLEAMAAGVPVIATAVGGNVEVLSGGAGLMVPPGSPQRLGEAVRLLAGDPELRARIARQGYLRVREDYSLEMMAIGWDKVYSTVLEGWAREGRT